MCRWPVRASTPLGSILWPIKWNEEHFIFHLRYKYSGPFVNGKYEELFHPKNPKMCDPILVTLLKMRPHYSQSSRENATPSSGTSPLASHKEVPPQPVCSLRTVCGLFNVLQNLYVHGLWDGTYGLPFLSKKTRKSNRLHYLYKWSTFFSVI